VARLRKTQSGLCPFVAFCSATFFCARKNASHFSLSGAKKRRIQPERKVKQVDIYHPSAPAKDDKGCFYMPIKELLFPDGK